MTVDSETTTAPGAADQRREDMLRGALEVIAEHGFPETRIADVAEQVGTSPALVIYYFKTKDKLLTEAMRFAEDRWYELGASRMASSTRAGPGPGARGHDLPLRSGHRAARFVGLWLDLWAQSVRHPEVAHVREEFDAHWPRSLATSSGLMPGIGEFDGSIRPGSPAPCRRCWTGSPFRSPSRTRWSTPNSRSAPACGTPRRHSDSPGSLAGTEVRPPPRSGSGVEGGQRPVRPVRRSLHLEAVCFRQAARCWQAGCFRVAVC